MESVRLYRALKRYPVAAMDGHGDRAPWLHHTIDAMKASHQSFCHPERRPQAAVEG